MLKVVILFVQYLVVIGTLSVPWPDSLSALFRAANFVFVASCGQVPSIDCLLGSTASSTAAAAVPLAVQRQLVYVLAPLAMLAGVFVVFALKTVALHSWVWCGNRLQKSPSPLVGRLPVMCVVVLFLLLISFPCEGSVRLLCMCVS